MEKEAKNMKLELHNKRWLIRNLYMDHSLENQVEVKQAAPVQIIKTKPQLLSRDLDDQ